jgi:hypothetical protein
MMTSSVMQVASLRVQSRQAGSLRYDEVNDPTKFGAELAPE